MLFTTWREFSATAGHARAHTTREARSILGGSTGVVAGTGIPRLLPASGLGHNGDVSKRVVIVGGGIIGLSCAYYLGREGHEVVVLDRGGADSERCSSGNGGIVCPSHFVPLAAPGMISMGLRMMFDPRGPFRIKPSLDPALLRWAWLFSRSATDRHVAAAAPVLRDLSLLSRKLFVELAAEADFGLTQRGLLAVCRTPEALAKESKLAERAHDLGLQAEILDPDGVRKADPGIDYDAVGAVLFPQDCHLDPVRFMGALRERILASGGDLRHGVEVSDLVTGEAVEAVQTSQGRIEADAFVIAGGAWTPKLAASAGISLPMQAGKGYSFTIDGPAQLPELTSLLIEGRLAVTPIGRQLRVSGTMEVAGLDLSVDTKRVEGIVDSFCRFCPKFAFGDFKGRPIWKGLRPVSPDGMPYLGPFRKFPNLLAATGHAMMGVSSAPVTGSLVSDWVAGRAPSVDTAMCSPDRFG